MRPWLHWRTLSTANYRFHFRPEFKLWTREVAQRVEAVDSALAALIGYPGRKPVDVVVDDPYATANGYAIPYVTRPATVWWTTPPDPRDHIGNFRTFGEMLAVHEIAHLAHLTRPSRNGLRRLWDRTFVNLGPVATKAPRWVHEGYATHIEGRLTGSGRPNNAHRPAVLRQWAIEGRLPPYARLSSTGGYMGGAFAYLGGSAFLDWLASREGDSSVVHIWRRLTARKTRSFDAAFAGVFGDAPAVLYGKHVAEVTRDAMNAKAALEAAGLREGDLIARRFWETGDPAISPDGARVAINLWDRGRPGRLVVWKTEASPPDTAAARKALAAMKRDPEDVPDRRFLPPPRKVERTLKSRNGRSFMMPRWFADNRRVLVTRWATRGDGSQSPALYVWDTQSGSVDAVTPPVGVSQGDPHPNGTEAVAMQCHWGHCDIAQVDLDRGTLLTLLEGNVRVTYHRPRYSPDGARIVAGVAEGGRWRVIVTDRRGRSMRYADPDDGANRYEAQWMGNDSLVVVSERGGIPNLELIDLTNGTTRSLSRVTGAAFGPEVNQSDRSIWFLSLHSRGLDVRRLAKDSAIADSVVTVSSDRFGFAGVRGPQPAANFPSGAVSPERSYGAGPRRHRLVPGTSQSADGIGTSLSVFSSDVVGRLSTTLTGADGDDGAWRGGALRIAWRYPRPHAELAAFAHMQEPSRARDPLPGADTLDHSLFQGLLALNGERRGDGWHVRARLGGAGGRLSPRYGGTHLRGIGFGEMSVAVSRSRGAQSLAGRLQLHVTEGTTRSEFRRSRVSLDLATAGYGLPLQLGATAGRLWGAPHEYEQFVIGGMRSPVGDSSVTTQRHNMPTYPTGVARGTALFGWRVALPWVLTAFYEGASVSNDPMRFQKWNRAIGVERRLELGPLPAILIPRTQIRVGAGYTLDAPFRRKFRAFLETRVEP